jgi:hypothetical protein
MAFYLWVRPIQEPFDLGVDERGRVQLVFNVNARKTPSNKFIEEVAKILVTGGVGAWGKVIFGSSLVTIPSGSGPYVSIIENSGLAPLYIQNSASPAYQQPSAQIIVRAADYAVARTTARVAYDALAAVRNATVTP